MAKIPLIHPIYLDVPMLVSFAAAMQGGLAREAEVTSGNTQSQETKSKVAGRIGLSQLFQQFFDASLSADLAADASSNTHELRKESRAHTEASIAIMLYHQLRESGDYIVQPKNIDDFQNYTPGMLIEIAGTIEKNAVDAVIDYMDAATILTKLDTSQSGRSGGQGRKGGKKSELEQMRDALNADRCRTPISNVVVHCTEPSGLQVVATLRTENLRDLTLSELHKNAVRVIGKITRAIPEGDEMISFENYGMALLPHKTLSEVFDGLTDNSDMNAEFGDITVKGPAFQLLPLMVFV